MQYSVSATGRNRRKIVNHAGTWWLLDFRTKSALPLDPLFQEAGWNVSALSAAVNMELRTFMRIVDRSLGINAKIWLRQLRVVAACHMIREEGRIEPVAARLGFHYESDFAREFRKLVGVSPSEYLKSELARSNHAFR